MGPGKTEEPLTTFLTGSELSGMGQTAIPAMKVRWPPVSEQPMTQAEIEAMWAWASGQEVAKSDGQTYIRTQTRDGGSVWASCPPFPTPPDLARGDLAWAIDALRWYWDVRLAMEGRLLGSFRTTQEDFTTCPGWGGYKGLAEALEARLGAVSGFPQFRIAALAMILPGQQELLFPRTARRTPGSGVGAGATSYYGNPTVAGQADGGYEPPSRPHPGRVAARIEALNFILKETDRKVLNTMFVHDSLWASYARKLYRAIRDLSLDDGELVTLFRNAATMLKAHFSVPWPHEFFASFVYAPRVPLPGFYRTTAFADAEILESDYFPVHPDTVERDLATFIAENAGALEEHFVAEFESWIARQQEKLEKARKRAERTETILKVFGAILSLLTAGTVGLIVTTAYTVVKLAIGTRNIRSIGDKTKDVIRSIFKALGTTEERLEEFKRWLALKASRMPPQEAPPTPKAAEEAQTRGKAPYSVFVEREFVALGEDPGELVRLGVRASKPGQRIVVKDEKTGAAAAIFVHTDDGQIVAVPEKDIGAVMALPPGEAGEIAGKRGTKVPWGLLAAAGAGAVVFLS